MARRSCRAVDNVLYSEAQPWRIGCFTRPWGRFDYTVAMNAIAAAGFKYVGLMSTKPKDDTPWALVITTDTSVDEPHRAGREAKRRGLQVVSVYGGRIPVARSLEAGIAGLRRLIDNCRAAGSPSLLLSGAGNGDPTAGVTVTPGTGRVDFPQVLNRLMEGGFTEGPLVIETLGPGNLDHLLREAVRGRRFMEGLADTSRP